MSVGSLAQFTLRAGVNKINTDIHNIGTPVSMMFDEAKNQMIETGVGVSGNLLYKRENTQLIATGADEYNDSLIDPFEHCQDEWSYRAVTLVLDGKEIQKNLGGYTLDELAAQDIIRSIPSGSRHTLINMISPRLTNLKITMDEWLARDFFYHTTDEQGRECANGIDVITEPDSTYANLSYNELGPLQFKSDLMKMGSGSGAAEMWNPIHLDLGTSAMEWKHIVAASTDLSKGMNYGIEAPNMSRGWNCFLMSTNRYNNSPMMARFDDDRRRMSSGDVEMSPTSPLIDHRLGSKFFSDPNLEDDGIMYFWKEGRIKKWMQKRKRYSDMLKRSRLSYNQDRVLIIAEVEYQYFTTQRWSTGWIKNDASDV